MRYDYAAEDHGAIQIRVTTSPAGGIAETARVD